MASIEELNRQAAQRVKAAAESNRKPAPPTDEQFAATREKDVAAALNASWGVAIMLIVFGGLGFLASFIGPMGDAMAGKPTDSTMPTISALAALAVIGIGFCLVALGNIAKKLDK